MPAPEFEGIANIVGGGLPDSRVTARSTALMIIDMQYVDAHRDHGIGAAGKANGLTAKMEYYFSRLETSTIPNLARILQRCREARLPVVHVRVMNKSGNSADTSWRYKCMGILVPPGHRDADFIEELAPVQGEIVLDKTTSSVFVSTNADFVLRNMGIDTLIMTGVVTNNCVESSTRTAGDLGYRVLLVEDATAARTQEGHDATIRHLDHNFAIVKSTRQILAEIDAAAAGLGAAGVAN